MEREYSRGCGGGGGRGASKGQERAEVDWSTRARVMDWASESGGIH